MTTAKFPCPTCASWLGLKRVHDGDGSCPVRASTWCSQCGCYGHRPSDCTAGLMWTRPRTLEELIPDDVRERWDIDTETTIVWTKPTLYDAEREIADNNTIVIRYLEGKMDGPIREFMKAQRCEELATVHKKEGNIEKLRRWAVSQGKKIRFDVIPTTTAEE